MKQLLFSLLLIGGELTAAEKLLGSSEGVDIFTKDLFTNHGHHYGNRFIARNKEKRQASVQLKFTGGKNVKNELSPVALAVPPLGETILGDIVQDDMHKEWEWYVDWVVTH